MRDYVNVFPHSHLCLPCPLGFPGLSYYGVSRASGGKGRYGKVLLLMDCQIWLYTLSLHSQLFLKLYVYSFNNVAWEVVSHLRSAAASKAVDLRQDNLIPGRISCLSQYSYMPFAQQNLKLKGD